MNDKIDIVDRLRSIWHDNDCTRALIEQAVDEIMQLRQLVTKLHEERDEARRMACEWGSNDGRGAKLIAQIQGWDCFKETR